MPSGIVERLTFVVVGVDSRSGGLVGSTAGLVFQGPINHVYSIGIQRLEILSKFPASLTISNLVKVNFHQVIVDCRASIDFFLNLLIIFACLFCVEPIFLLN